MDRYPESQAVARLLSVGAFVVIATLLGACSEPAQRSARSGNDDATGTCESFADTALGEDALTGLIEPAVSTDPHSSARWYLDGRVTVRDLAQFYRRINYELTAVSMGAASVPRLLTARMPSDLREVHDVQRRKAVFIATVLPIALQVNEAILRTRQTVLAMADCIGRAKKLPDAAQGWLEMLHDRYGSGGDVDNLIQRIDAVPPSLILAQAAIESDWGASQVTNQGNALFAERKDRSSQGMVADNADREVDLPARRFETLLESIETYVYKLNVSHAHAEFRKIRAMSRNGVDPPDSLALAQGLGGYSQRGAEYISDIRNLISENRLKAFDHAELEQTDDPVTTRIIRIRGTDVDI